MTAAKLFAPLLIALACGPAAATPLTPPPAYDHTFSGTIDLHLINRDNVWAECSGNGKWPARTDVAGCADLSGKHCTIWLAIKTRRAPLDAILRHEVAHCNGWVHD